MPARVERVELVAPFDVLMRFFGLTEIFIQARPDTECHCNIGIKLDGFLDESCCTVPYQPTTKRSAWAAIATTSAVTPIQRKRARCAFYLD